MCHMGHRKRFTCLVGIEEDTKKHLLTDISHAVGNDENPRKLLEHKGCN